MTTRERLLAATAEALREDGIAGLSARTIATRADVNQALVFYHFGTMSQLVQEATRKSVDDSIAHYREPLASAGTLSELLAVGRTLHEREREAGNVALMAQVMAGAQQDEALAEAAAYAMGAWGAEIEQTLVRVLATTPLSAVVDAKGLSQAICAAFIGLELFEGVDALGGSAAFDTLAQLGTMVESVDGLGPVASRAVRATLRRSGR